MSRRRTPAPGDRILVLGLLGEDDVSETLVEVERIQAATSAMPAGIVSRTVLGDDLSGSRTWTALDGPSWEWPDDR